MEKLGDVWGQAASIEWDAEARRIGRDTVWWKEGFDGMWGGKGGEGERQASENGEGVNYPWCNGMLSVSSISEVSSVFIGL